jgi:hypothetical protein
MNRVTETLMVSASLRRCSPLTFHDAHQGVPIAIPFFNTSPQ